MRTKGVLFFGYIGKRKRKKVNKLISGFDIANTFYCVFNFDKRFIQQSGHCKIIIRKEFMKCEVYL